MLVPFIILLCINIIDIIHDLGALEVTQKIKVMNFLQDDK